jgi:4-diphosphocytidyl-2-C-methyl-D-erythritol kinase
MIKYIKSFAKINLNLKIWKKEINWFHKISSHFQKISLSDKISFEDLEWEKIKIETFWEFRKIPTNAENICFKAWKEMQKFAKWKRWIKIILEKNIPLKAGLWWWSSNCAEVLKFLNSHWKINFSEKKLVEIWLKLGSDVPFFIKKENSLKVFWFWEKFKYKKNLFVKNYIIIFQLENVFISTAWAFLEFDKKVFWDLKNNFENDFEKIIYTIFPDLFFIKSFFEKNWSKKAGLSGSGSSIFWIFEKEKDAKKVLEKIKLKGFWGVFKVL